MTGSHVSSLTIVGVTLTSLLGGCRPCPPCELLLSAQASGTASSGASECQDQPRLDPMPQDGGPSLDATPPPQMQDDDQQDSSISEPGQCEPVDLDRGRWLHVSGLVIHEATTCRYRSTLYGRYRYNYAPNTDGWIGDYFITGDAHGIVYWNVRTGSVIVRPRRSNSLTADGARQVALHARGTVYPGIDIDTLQFDLRSCDEQPCPPWGSGR